MSTCVILLCISNLLQVFSKCDIPHTFILHFILQKKHMEFSTNYKTSGRNNNKLPVDNFHAFHIPCSAKCPFLCRAGCGLEQTIIISTRIKKYCTIMHLYLTLRATLQKGAKAKVKSKQKQVHTSWQQLHSIPCAAPWRSYCCMR